jgi:hypothetical protein
MENLHIPAKGFIRGLIRNSLRPARRYERHAHAAPFTDRRLSCASGAHAVDEHVIVADLPFRFALMARLIETL